MRTSLALILLLGAAAVAAAGDDEATEETAKISAAEAAQTVAPEVAVETAIHWLLEHQNEDGSWGDYPDARREFGAGVGRT